MTVFMDSSCTRRVLLPAHVYAYSWKAKLVEDEDVLERRAPAAEDEMFLQMCVYVCRVERRTRIAGRRCEAVRLTEDVYLFYLRSRARNAPE